ncbi:MAG: hypothetical protein AB8H12_02300 [Lewinella sp.]
MWFRRLVGFHENNPEQVRENLILEGEFITSRVNGKKMKCGTLMIPSLQELRDEAQDLTSYGGQISIDEKVGDIQRIHLNNPGATFQAASQFNLLEMASPEYTPEQGVDIYDNDHTQGPACAIACGAGTIYRNYFVALEGQTGQTRSRQVDCLAEIGSYFNNDQLSHWKMENGYAFATEKGLQYISTIIKQLNEQEYEELEGKLRVGVQANTEMTIDPDGGLVTQVYCSALPIRYTDVATDKWEAFARLVLEATYEATFHAALNNYAATGNNKLFLTLVGGGVFGNPMTWILAAIEKSILKFKHTPLEVSIVSYGSSKPSVRRFLSELHGRI